MHLRSTLAKNGWQSHRKRTKSHTHIRVQSRQSTVYAIKSCRMEVKTVATAKKHSRSQK